MWEHADISHSEPYGGRLEAALAAIEAKAIVLPGASDVYFPAEDSANEVRHMRNARLLPIPSPWGHWAGNGRRAEDLAFIDAALSALLSPHERICEP
jgi:homoserine O-acetyltransferase